MTRRVAIVFGVADLLTAALVTLGVFVGLPARWVVVDVTAGALVALKVASGVLLMVRARRAHTMAIAAAVVALALGLALVTTLALTASWLSGVYGPVGRGGALLLALVAALALPYLVVLPAAQLFWFLPAPKAGG